MFGKKKALLLDMNSTFMFGEDRFGENEDYSDYYKTVGGELADSVVNGIIEKVLKYLGKRYPDEKYRNNFPSLADAISTVADIELSADEIQKIIGTFSYHEHGYIPDQYVKALFKLKTKYTLAVVIDIWSPKERWVNTFQQHGILELFSAASFSSDHGMVKPSPKPFELVVSELGITKDSCLFIGDSVRRDLGGAISAGIDCVLVGGATDEGALNSYPDLLSFCEKTT